MNRKPSLESLDLELLAAIQRERQAEMRREARQAYVLGGHSSNGKHGQAVLKRRLALALAMGMLIALGLAPFVFAAP